MFNKVKFKMFLNEEKNKKHQVNEDVQEIQEYFQKISSGIHQKELDEIADVVRDAKKGCLANIRHPFCNM